MAVERMLKVTVLGHRVVLGDLVDSMHRAGVLQVEALEEGVAPDTVVPDASRMHLLEEYRADAVFVRKFLGRFHTPEQALSSFISEKTHISESDFLSLEADAELLHLYEQCEEISSDLATLARERARLVALAAELAPWEGLRLQIGRWQATEHVAVFAGTVPAFEGPAIRQLLRDLSPLITVEELSSVGGRSAWIVMTYRGVLEQARALLSGTNFEDVSFPGLNDYPAEERAQALARIGEIDAESASLEAQGAELSAQHYHRSVAMVEAIEAEIERLTVTERFGATERAFVVSGWVTERRREDLLSALEPMGEAVDVAFAEPTSDDEPPVELRNPWFLRPFEVLTDLYGRPRYDEVDPTPLLAPFFLLFFSICIADVGYGAMLVLGAWLIKTRLDVAPGVKKFMDLLIAGGAGAMVVGVAFGSYFAWDIAELPAVLQSLQIIDPMKELPTFLIITVALGVTQVVFGVLVAAWELARKGDWASAFFDQLSTLVLFGALAVAVLVPGASGLAMALGLGMTMLFKGRALEAALRGSDRPAWDRLMGLVWLAVFIGWLVMIGIRGTWPLGWALLAYTPVALAVSKVARAVVVGLLGGAYAVYGMSAFIGDILSYTRLAALSLSGALVGMVFNLLARLVGSGAAGLFEAGGTSIIGGVVVVVLAALVFAGGHVFNVVINLLGAFVHPARLQFVEFFSKFYEGGGRSFEPLAFRSKTLVLHADTVRQEGART